MAQHSSNGNILGILAFATSCAIGLIATTYGVTIAYLMGANAQAQADDTTVAPPDVLLRNSLQQTLDKARNGAFGTITVEDTSVEVNNASGKDVSAPSVEVVG